MRRPLIVAVQEREHYGKRRCGGPTGHSGEANRALAGGSLAPSPYRPSPYRNVYLHDDLTVTLCVAFTQRRKRELHRGAASELSGKSGKYVRWFSRFRG